MEPGLADAFLNRVKAAYRRALAATSPTRDQWAAIDARRADVHAALLTGSNEALRAIFADPTTTDLYYGVDRLCRSHVRLNDASEFVAEALNPNDGRVRGATYQIDRLREINPAARSIVEIGPGMGRAAYCGHRAGFDVTTIDLPLGIVAQAAFLGQALRPDALWFEGEEDALSEGRIKLLYRTPLRRFDFALNVDSLTEMPPAVAFAYMRWAAAFTPCLLSINHDKNRFTVAELAAFAAPRRVLINRPCPMRGGYSVELCYAEEVFVFGGPDRIPRRVRLAAFEAFLFGRRMQRALARRLSQRR